MDQSPATLFTQLEQLNEAETKHLSMAACHSDKGVRRHNEPQQGYRQSFSLDADRIIHSRAYTRYIDKTQVFCLVANDHITHRVLHVQLVSRIARTIGRFLHLNEDLIEAISLGHDIGHPPFGHDGEKVLSSLCEENGLPPFQHNIQSVRFLDHLERKGRGWNLTVQTLDGILCHDGEIHDQSLHHKPDYDFNSFDRKLTAKSKDPKHALTPMSLEGCVVRLADTIAYIGRDIEDAIVLGLVNRDDLPETSTILLGNTNGSIVYNLVTDLLSNSKVTAPGDSSGTRCHIGFGKQTSDVLKSLKTFNYKNIYFHPKTKKELPKIANCYKELFYYYLDHLSKGNKKSSLQVDLMSNMQDKYLNKQPPAAMIRDFIAGMTDNYFLTQAAQIGCQVPDKS